MAAPNDGACAALDVLVRLIADAVVERLRAADSHNDMLDQSRSPLTSKRHCAIVRARLARGAGGAAIAGRKHLITRAALQEELDAINARAKRRHHKLTAVTSPEPDDLDDYLKRYGVERKAS